MCLLNILRVSGFTFVALPIDLNDSVTDLRMSYDVCDRMLTQSSTQGEIALTVEVLDSNTEEASDQLSIILASNITFVLRYLQKW